MRAKLVNESIKHLTPRSEEELQAIFKNLSPEEKFKTGIEQGITWIVKDAIAAGATNIHYGDDWPLKNACDNGYYEITKLLIDNGANVHHFSDYALRHASFHGYYKIVKLLLDAGADVHAANDEPLRWARGERHTEIVKLLKQYM